MCYIISTHKRLQVIHFETSRFNIKIFARVLAFSSEVFHLEIYSEYISRTVGRERESWERHELPVSSGLLKKMGNEVGYQRKNCTCSNTLFS